MIRFIGRLISLNRSGTREIVPTFPMGDHIPKVIHQTFRAPPWLPEIEANVRNLKAGNPSWVHRFHNYEDRLDFIKQNYGSRILALYECIGAPYGAAKADLFRYLLLYKEGGVYLDMKSSARYPLDEVIEDSDLFLLSKWRGEGFDHAPSWGQHRELAHLAYGEYQQWFIASAPGHPYLRRVIEYVLRNIEVYFEGLHGTGAYGVLRVTGPVAYTLAIESVYDPKMHRVVDAVSELGLVYSIFGEGASEAHRGKFPHYTQLDSPVVVHGIFRNAVGKSIKLLKRTIK